MFDCGAGAIREGYGCSPHVYPAVLSNPSVVQSKPPLVTSPNSALLRQTLGSDKQSSPASQVSQIKGTKYTPNPTPTHSNMARNKRQNVGQTPASTSLVSYETGANPANPRLYSNYSLYSDHQLPHTALSNSMHYTGPVLQTGMAQGPMMPQNPYPHQTLTSNGWNMPLQQRQEPPPMFALRLDEEGPMFPDPNENEFFSRLSVSATEELRRKINSHSADPRAINYLSSEFQNNVSYGPQYQVHSTPFGPMGDRGHFMRAETATRNYSLTANAPTYFPHDELRQDRARKHKASEQIMTELSLALNMRSRFKPGSKDYKFWDSQLVLLNREFVQLHDKEEYDIHEDHHAPTKLRKSSKIKSKNLKHVTNKKGEKSAIGAAKKKKSNIKVLSPGDLAEGETFFAEKDNIRYVITVVSL